MLLETFADEIIDMISRFLPERTVNIMDTSGIIISSTEKYRIGTFHKGAEIAAATGTIVNITEETVENYPGAKKGCNVPLVVNGTIIGVIGIFGNPEEIKTLASFVELYAEKYYQLEAVAIPRLRDSEMKQRLLKEMIMPSREDGIKVLLEKLGICLCFPMECCVFSPSNIENRAEWERTILETLKNEKNNNRLTELNHLILDFMRENKDKYDNSFSSKIIAEGLDTAAKKISGSIRKLVNLGLVEKTNENPVIYALRED